MGTKNNKSISSVWIFLLLAILGTRSESHVEGLQPLHKAYFGPEPKGTIKTIEALEVGDIIDCVDIYKQPAFDNPHIQDLKMAPSSYHSAFNKTSDPQPKLIQTWNKYGECPAGTIPIRRTSDNDTIHRKYNHYHEYATVVQYFKKGNGGKAFFNLWKPHVATKQEFSLSQMWVASGYGEHLNTVEAGWMVYPQLFHDSETRLFIYWSRNNYKKGCYNLICSGFVQIKNNIALGAALEPVSVYDGLSTALLIALTRSQEGDWWLLVHDEFLGFFPRQLFTTLGDGADRIAFGGEILNLATRRRHTDTVMGSGHFSAEAFQKASCVCNIQIINDKFDLVEPNLTAQTITKPACYDLTFGKPGTKMGSHFYFGGPGFSSRCQ